MAYYLMQMAYTDEALAALVANPQDRLVAAARPVAESLGGSVVGFWFSFGEYDVVTVCQLPDNVSAAAISMAVSATGVAKAYKTTPLMTVEEGVEAMKKAKIAKYQPPRG